MAALVGVLMFADTLSRADRVAASIGALIAVAGIVALMRLVPSRPVTLGAMYLLIFALFHAGVLPYVIAGSTPDLLVGADWFQSSARGAAITSVAVAMLAFMAGYASVLSTRAVSRVGHRPDPGPDEPRSGHGVGLVGFGLVAVGILLWFGVVIARTGTELVTQSYEAFLARTHDSPVSLTYLFIGLGLGALGLSPDASLRRWGLIAFATFAVPAFLIGLRGEVIFPLAAWSVATARRRHVKVRVGGLALLLGALTMGSVIRQIREVGFSTTALKQVVVNPLDGLAELGASLRPLVIVHEWHSYQAEPFVGWGTYWAPLERLILGRLLGLSVPETTADPRVLITTIFDRVGPVGGSPAAESFRAAGLLGIVVVLALIGLLTGWLDTRTAGSPVTPALGTIGYVLLYWIRDDFTPVVFGSLVCLLIVGLGAGLDAVRNARGGKAVPLPDRLPLASG